MAYPAYESSGTVDYRYGNLYLDVSYPATVNSGDILFGLVLRRYFPASQTFSAATGWTKIGEYAQSYGELAVWWRRADGTESGTQRFEWTGATSSQHNWGVIHRFSGCVGSGTPYEDSDSSYARDTTVTIPAMTCSGTERLAVSLGGCQGLTSVNDDATYYTRAAIPYSTESIDCVFPVFTQQVASAGVVAADSYTKPDVTYDDWGQLSLVIIPVATPTGYANKVNGVAAASIGKVNGVATASISEVLGV